MPTIEVVSVSTEKLNLNQNNFEIALIEESKLESHRGLFYDWLIEQKGVIVHLGNPDFKENKDGGFYANELIDWNFEPSTIELPKLDKGEKGAKQISGFKFLTDYQIEVAQILEKAVNASPEHRAYFLTDIQFGANKGEILEMNLNEF